MTIAGVILAGGNSVRMGEEKALVALSGRPLIEHVLERFARQVPALAVNANGDPGRFAKYNLPVLPDDRPDTGPLAGILAAMRWASTLPERPAFVATVPIDTPFVPRDLVKRLDAGRDEHSRIVIAASGDRDHPVVGLWPIDLADTLEAWRMTARSQGVRAFLAASGFGVVNFERSPDGPDPFLNTNTPAELDEAAGWLSALARD